MKKIILFTLTTIVLSPFIVNAYVKDTKTLHADKIGKIFAVLHGHINTTTPTEDNLNLFLVNSNDKTGQNCNQRGERIGPLESNRLVGTKGSGDFIFNQVNLKPNTTYWYCAATIKIELWRKNIFSTATPHMFILAGGKYESFTTLDSNGNNNGGSKGGGVGDIKADPTLPRPDLIGNVITKPIKFTSDVEAMLVGNVDRVGDPSYGYFRFSSAKKPPIFCNDIYGSNMRSVTASNTEAGQYNNDNKDGKIKAGNFYGLATDLKPNTEYYYCAAVSNNAKNPTEIEYENGGKVLKFKTKPCPTCDQTDVVTDVATNIGYDTARLRGSYFTNEDMDTYFEYQKYTVNNNTGPTGGASGVTNNNWTETGEKVNHKENSYGKISTTIEGLESSTAYAFRAVGKTTKGKKLYYGSILSFVTHSDPSEHGILIEDTGDNDPGTGTGTGTHGYEIEDPDGVGDYDNDGEPNDTDDDDGIDDDEDGYDYDDETDDDIDDDGIENENDDDDGADNDGDGYDADDDDSDNDGINDENDDNDGIDSDGDGTDNDDDDSDNDGEENANDDNDGIDSDGDGSDRDTDDHDNDGEPDSDDDDDGLDSDGDGKDADDSDRDNDGEKDSDDDNDGFDDDGDGKDADDSDRDNDGEPDKYDDNDGFDDDGDGSDRDGKVLSKKIGQISNPPQNAIVRYHEGIEHVIYRQIKADASLAKNYGEINNDGSESYYWNVAHQMAIDFAYVDRETGREIRVSQPDVSAYELEQVEDKLYVYESHLDKKVWRVIDVRETTTIFKNKNPFEYYFKKIKKFFGF